MTLRTFGRKNHAQIYPNHIAIVMDGNGRWAKQRGLPRTSGHYAGMMKAKKVIQHCDDLGIKYLTLFGWSTENWIRPSSEVDYIMRLPGIYFEKEINELVTRNIQFRFMGEIEKIPEDTLFHLRECEKKTKNNTGMIVNFAFNYGGRSDIIRAVQSLGMEASRGEISIEDITEDAIEMRLMTGDIPNPDLVIRTSGENRLSNFMLWQVSFSELWFTDAFWPSFNRRTLMQAINDYSKRKRINS